MTDRLLSSYRPQHDEGCDSRLCLTCESTIKFHREILSVLDNPHPFQPKPCSCNLDHALAQAAQQAQEIERLKQISDAAFHVVMQYSSGTEESTMRAVRELDALFQSSAALTPSVEQAKDELLSAIAHVAGQSVESINVELGSEVDALIAALRREQGQDYGGIGQ